MPKIIDVTVPLSSALPAYPGDPQFELRFSHRIADGRPYNAAAFSMGAHAGTHVDAPFHFVPDGATVEQLPLEILIGKTRVVELRGPGAIEREDLEALDLRDDLRVLIKTRVAGQPQLADDFVHLSADAATYLVQAGLKLVGIDSISIDALDTTEFPAHQALLRASVVVVEGLDLAGAEPGEYEMICLPLRIPGADGAPARVILRTRM
jgi:arylformamidase